MKTILCYGDSNTYGYNPANKLRYDEEIRWTCQLQSLLGKDYRVIAEGCNGRTTIYADKKEKWKRGDTYLRPCLNTHKPIDLVILMLGTNDFKKMFHNNPVKVARGMERLLRIIKNFTREKQGEEAEILLLSPPYIGQDITKGPFRKSFDQKAHVQSMELAGFYKKLAKKYHCYFMDAASYASFSKEDHLHLTEEAHTHMAQMIYKKVLDIFPNV